MNTTSKILFAFLVVATLGGLLQTQAGAQQTPSADLDATIGFSALSTSPLAVSANTATIIGTIPSGKHSVRITAYHSDINVGGSDVASGVYAEKISSGSTLVITGIVSRNPTIYLIGRTAAASATIIAK